MKKYVLIFFSAIVFVFFSCSKNNGNKNVHFHGSLTSPCDGTPEAHATLEIYREWDDAYQGNTERDSLATVTTDNNGSYSALCEVTDHGTFRDYLIIAYSGYSGQEVGYATSTGSGTDVTINVYKVLTSALSFHIKNISPYDNNDLFDTLKIKRSDGYYDYVFKSYHVLAKGMNVDTTIYANTNWEATKTIQYCWIKNGIVSVKDTTIHLACLSTKVDIYY